MHKQTGEHENKKPPLPGGVLQGYYLHRLGMSKEDLAKTIKVHVQNIRFLGLPGYKVDRRLATKLSNITGTTPELWIKLQSDFDEWVKVEREKRNEDL